MRMSGQLADLLGALLACVLLYALAPVLDDDDDQAVAVPDDQPPGTPSRRDGSSRAADVQREPGWLPATLQPVLAACPPWQPRVCAGRVAGPSRIRDFYLAADYPVSAYSWPERQQAQEVAA